MIDWNLRIPWGYSTSTRTLAEARDLLAVHYHPEFIRRLCAWLSSRNGHIGIGGTWRAGGAQPDKPGFAPEGRSFHQDQNFADGFTGACAVDLVAVDPGKVHRAPLWNEVPAQGSAEARTWGVHCNVGAPGAYGSEPWHMQPIEIDGWQTWWDAGRPAPKPGYPLPTDPTQPDLPPEEPDMAQLRVVKIRFDGYADQLVGFRASADTMTTGGIVSDPVVVLTRPTESQRASIEAQLGRPLKPLA